MTSLGVLGLVLGAVGFALAVYSHWAERRLAQLQRIRDRAQAYRAAEESPRTEAAFQRMLEARWALDDALNPKRRRRVDV